MREDQVIDNDTVNQPQTTADGHVVQAAEVAPAVLDQELDQENDEERGEAFHELPQTPMFRAEVVRAQLPMRAARPVVRDIPPRLIRNLFGTPAVTMTRFMDSVNRSTHLTMR